jgi:hypothetical protein
MSKRLRSILALVLVLPLLGGCATTYQKSSVTGGFSEQQLEGDIWRVRFAGNGFVSHESVQSYWLYRCAEVALEKGYGGFEILSDVRLTLLAPPEQLMAGTQAGMQPTQFIYIPMDTGPKPAIEADIRLLKGEVEPAPPRVFNAQVLLDALRPHVEGEKCSGGNVCPHPHTYIYGAGKDAEL